MREPRLTEVADSAVLVDFADELDEAAHAAALALDRALADDPPPGLVETVPAYVGLSVVFDPLVTDHRAIDEAIRRALAAEAAPITAGRLRVVPVCYDGDFGRDLPEVAALTGLGVEAVIAGHLSGDYRVYMYGFAPGYAYLGGVPEPLRLPRKPVPVRGVAAGSVIVAGPQCLVTTLEMPTGWWIVGRSPLRVLTGDSMRPFLFDVGDRLAFRRIGRAEFDRLAAGAS